MIARAAIGNPDIFLQTRKMLVDGQQPSPPDLARRMNLAEIHLRHAIDTFGEETAAKTIRKHFARYFSGFQAASRLRLQLMRAENIDSMLKILSSGQSETDRNTH